jgi:hypothetical protein
MLLVRSVPAISTIFLSAHSRRGYDSTGLSSVVVGDKAEMNVVPVYVVRLAYKLNAKLGETMHRIYRRTLLCPTPGVTLVVTDVNSCYQTD